MEIKPYRVDPTKAWFENVYIGEYGYGVSWRWRDNAETLEWTGQDGAWWDKIDDGNSTHWIQDTDGEVGGSPPPTKPGNWINFTVTNSVKAWYTQGATNNGFSLFSTGFVGSGTTVYGIFSSRDHTTAWSRPKLQITYEGALLPIADADGPYGVSAGGSVMFDGSGSYDPDGGDIASWLWDLDGDGSYDDASGETSTKSYTYLVATMHLIPGEHTIGLKVIDDESESRTDTSQLEIIVPYAVGDMNCDGAIDNFDIDPFVLALTSASHPEPFDDYYAVWPNCHGMLADCNTDKAVDNFDIDSFVKLLTGE